VLCADWPPPPGAGSRHDGLEMNFVIVTSAAPAANDDAATVDAAAKTYAHHESKADNNTLKGYPVRRGLDNRRGRRRRGGQPTPTGIDERVAGETALLEMILHFNLGRGYVGPHMLQVDLATEWERNVVPPTRVS